MKRLISWLLALTMIMSLPLSAFAAGTDVEIGEGEPDINVGFEELLPGYTEANPIDLTQDLLYEGDFTATVTVPAGATLYYCAYRVGGMIMTINGGAAVECVAASPMVPYAWTITNDGAADAEYVIVIAAPLGSMDNPATLTLGENNATVAADARGYFFTYTAEQTGTLVLEFASSVGGWTYAVNNLTTGAYGDTQWSDSDPVVNPYEVEVAAGDKLQIMVCTYDATNPWNAPAGTVTVNASYKAEGPVIDENLKFYRSNTSGGDLMLGDDIRASFMIKAVAGYDRIYLEITKDGVTSIVDKNDLSNATYFRYAYVVPAAHMTMDINVTIWGEKEGKTYRGEELLFSIRRCAEAKLAAWINNPAAAGQCKLIMNMLYYGEKAQIQFGANTENLATAGLEKTYTDLINKEQPTLKAYPTVDESGMTATIYNMGFMLQEKVKLTTIFKLNTAITNAEEYTVEVKHIPTKEGVAPVTYTFTSEDFEVLSGNKMIRFFFDKIAPSQMRDDVQFTLYHNGEAISATYVRSMETVANAYAKNAAIADLVYAVMNYADAAKAVFG